MPLYKKTNILYGGQVMLTQQSYQEMYGPRTGEGGERSWGKIIAVGGAVLIGAVSLVGYVRQDIQDTLVAKAKAAVNRFVGKEISAENLLATIRSELGNNSDFCIRVHDTSDSKKVVVLISVPQGSNREIIFPLLAELADQYGSKDKPIRAFLEGASTEKLVQSTNILRSGRDSLEEEAQMYNAMSRGWLQSGLQKEGFDVSDRKLAQGVSEYHEKKDSLEERAQKCFGVAGQDILDGDLDLLGDDVVEYAALSMDAAGDCRIRNGKKAGGLEVFATRDNAEDHMRELGEKCGNIPTTYVVVSAPPPQEIAANFGK